MDRREYLRNAVVAGTVPLVAGCLGSSGGSSKTHFGKPKDQAAKSADLPYPAWGQQLPSVTVPAPLQGGTEVTIPDQFSGKNVMLTFFYSHCPAVCQIMISQLRSIQTDAVNNGYADEVVFLAVDFDPARDTADRLRSYAKEKHVDLNAGNWYFLRPKSPARAKSVVQDTYGIKFQKTTPKNADPGVYYFNHLGMIFLANRRGYVERTYQFTQTGNSPWQSKRDDLKKLINEEG